MKLDNVFTVGVPASQAWSVLTDLELIAPCMPGAALTGVNDGVYTGKVKIKVGPITAEYAGTAQFTEKDDASYRAVIDARGRDTRGNGNATAVISAELRPDGDSTVVIVTTDLTIAGRIAQFGSGMIKEVSATLLGQFVTCLEAKLGAGLPVATSAFARAEPETASATGTEGVAPAAAGLATTSEPNGETPAASTPATVVPAATAGLATTAGPAATADLASAVGVAATAGTAGPAEPATTPGLAAAAGPSDTADPVAANPASAEPATTVGLAAAAGPSDTADRVAAGPATAGHAAVGFSATAGAGAELAAEPVPIDLVGLAGEAITKRLAPAVLGLVMLALVIYLTVRW
jgi:uncharacterized protein